MIKTIAISLMFINNVVAIQNVDNFMPFMDYRCLTNEESIQYQVQKDAVTNDEGFRTVDGKYLVALYYGKKGPKYNVKDELYLDIDGKIIEVMVGDLRPTKGTENVVEFIVDTKKVAKSVRISGSCISCFKQQ